ncbi:hypothetical protein Aduo_002360 [Ancylostoma duodenale]
MGPGYWINVFISNDTILRFTSWARGRETGRGRVEHGNYSIVHELITCSACGSKNYHGIRRIKELAIRPAVV